MKRGQNHISKKRREMIQGNGIGNEEDEMEKGKIDGKLIT